MGASPHGTLAVREWHCEGRRQVKIGGQVPGGWRGLSKAGSPASRPDHHQATAIVATGEIALPPRIVAGDRGADELVNTAEAGRHARQHHHVR
jgi:hypothetical protein